MLRLYWWDDNTNQWLPAGNMSNLADNSGDPLYTGFVLGEPTDVLGDWGVDLVHHLVWANLDHGSTFSIAEVPEPSALALLLPAGVWFALRRRSSTKNGHSITQGQEADLSPLSSDNQFSESRTSRSYRAPTGSSIWTWYIARSQLAVSV